MHVIRMSFYTGMLAKKAGLTEAEADLIMHASMMHDIGKIGISDLILLKPGKLTLAITSSSCSSSPRP